ncbi:MAG: MlaE family ABC transporter permease [Limisphaerales bacterium]
MDNLTQPSLNVRRNDQGSLVVELAGDWLAQPGLPGLEAVDREFANGPAPHRVTLSASKLGRWNSGLLAWVRKCRDRCAERGAGFDTTGMPSGVQQLLRLTEAAPARPDANRATIRIPFLQRVGETALAAGTAGGELLAFLGDTVLAFGRLLRGRAQFRWGDVATVMQQSGPQALGIVALINFLIGMILAFVGAVQLTQFGASIYVADMVAIAVVREMGCIMTAIILCGRTGAAFAAELGTMKVSQEIDALRTFGIPPMEFLVLPRLVALVLMMPLLCVFADVIAIGGGFFVATLMLDVTPTEYLIRTIEAITVSSFLLGIFKGGFFGLLVALSGCLRGIQCGRDAAAVGRATTAAVVAGITAIIAADGVFAVICNALNI